jgi:putative nucleotidyltransferase with HDIG domain
MKWDIDIKKIITQLKERKPSAANFREYGIKIFLAILIMVIIVLLMPKERPFEYSNLTVGSIAPEEIIAPFTFPIIKSSNVLQKEKQEARLRIPSVFQYNGDVKNVQILKVQTLLEDINSFLKTFNNKTKKLLQKPDTSTANLVLLDSMTAQLSTKYNFELTNDDLISVFNLFKDKKLQDFVDNLTLAFSRIYEKGIINITKNEIAESDITIIKDGLEEKQNINDMLDLHEAREIMQDFLLSKYDANNDIQSFISKVLISFLEPDLEFNSDLTRSRKSKAEREVPSTSGYVYENQRIIDSHEIVTEDIYQKLRSLAIALAERDELKGGMDRFLFYIGQILFAFIIVSIIAACLYFFRLKLFYQNKMLILITLIFLIQFLISGLFSDILGWPYLSIPIILAPMLFAMLLDAFIAFLGTVIISIVLGAAGGSNFHLVFMTLVVGTIALFSIRKIRNRGQMFRAILYIILGYVMVNLSFGLIHFERLSQMLQNFFIYQIPNAILVPTSVFLLIGLFEKFFDVTTDITLLELSDLNHPLLKRLSVEAPGTFHHSIVVGNLAEAAAKEIGANSLLGRVGCYYHDIGKMQLSEYFVENQSNAINKHESLTPNMSSLILSKHVRAGLDLAEEYGLPLAVRQFIPEHHGTSIMSYFYHKAQETMDPKDINENDFRYPGPKPQSKETAIAMLADTVEAASRTLPSPNLQRISTLVDNLIEKRFQEGELDECDITLRELNKVKGAFIRVLMGIHHLRIEYPVEEKQKDKIKKASGEGGRNVKINSEVERIVEPTHQSDKKSKTVVNSNNRSVSGKKENRNHTD